METMEHELIFLNMLGYKVAELQDDKTTCDILDENDNKVGIIQKKEFQQKTENEGTSVLGYTMEINSDTISFKNTRRLDNDYGLFNYEFDIKRKNGNDHAEVSCGQFPSIVIHSKEYGFMNFKLSYDGLFASFKSQTKRFDIEELVSFKYKTNDREKGLLEKEYVYQIGYCDKTHSLFDSKPRENKSQTIIAKYNSYRHKPNQVDINEETWGNGDIISSRTNTYEGTVEEVTEKNQMGIDAVSHLRYLLNSILPFKQEIMSAMLTKTPYVVEQGIELFLPDIIGELRKNNCHECSTQGTCDMLEITEGTTLNKHKRLIGRLFKRI